MPRFSSPPCDGWAVVHNVTEDGDPTLHDFVGDASVRERNQCYEALRRRGPDPEGIREG